MAVKGKEKEKTIDTHRTWLSLPRKLYLACKAVARAQGLPLRYAVIEGMKMWLQAQAEWEKFVNQQAARPEATERGPVLKDLD